MAILKAQQGTRLRKLWEDTKKDFHKQYVPEGMTKKDYDTMSGTIFNIGGLSKIGAAPDALAKTTKFVADKAKGLLGKVSPTKFKSEINWGTWNKEIPTNKTLLDEYHTIEKTSKAKGTWMKNPDGSKFDGSPEQFVQQNSANFKKAFPAGHNKVYRGVHETVGPIADNKAMFTADEELAKWYAVKPNTRIADESVKSGVYDLAHKKSPNSLDMETWDSYWTDVNLKGDNALSKEVVEDNIARKLQQIEDHKKFLSTAKQKPDGSWSFPNSDYDYSDDLYRAGTKDLEHDLSRHTERLKRVDNPADNPAVLKTLRDKLGDTTTTNDIAKHLESTDIDYVKLRNVHDGNFGDVTIVNNRKGNYLKSLRGNNGMFDMTNPNIFKTAAPLAVVGTGAGLLKKKQNTQ